MLMTINLSCFMLRPRASTKHNFYGDSDSVGQALL